MDRQQVWKHNYNIPSNNRELQLPQNYLVEVFNYNIPSNNRELQHMTVLTVLRPYYNIPSNNRELQLFRKKALYA